MAHIRPRLRVGIPPPGCHLSRRVLKVSRETLSTSTSFSQGHIEPTSDRGPGFQYIPKQR